MQIDPKQVQWDSPAIDASQVKWDAPSQPQGYTLKQAAKDFMTIPRGVYRGVQDVSDTLVKGGASLADMVLGGNEARQSVDRSAQANEQQFQQDYGNSNIAGASRLAGNIGATLPVGGGLAKTVEMIPGAAQKVAPLIQALRSSGMNAGGATGAAGVGARVAGGAATGGVSAGLVNPDDAAMGASIGAAMPGVVKVAGEAGMALGNRAAKQYADELTRFNRSAPKRETLKQSIDAGYVVPPNMVNPSMKNSIIESLSGKQATGQLASVKNQEVTEKLVRESLGIADDAPLTKTALEQIRKTEGGAYKDVANLSPQAEIDLEALKKARNEAQGWFNAYNRSASPDDLAKAKNFRDTAEVLELNLESHAKNAGKDQLISRLRDARKQIAKTYTVERALNDATGTVNAKVLGRIYDKGMPLSDGLDTVGRFASGFPSVNQASQQMGSPGAHNLRAVTSGGAGALGALTMGPAGLAAAALPYAAGAGSRSMMFSKGAQKALANQQAPTANNAQLAALLRNPEVQQLLTRTAPVGITAE